MLIKLELNLAFRSQVPFCAKWLGDGKERAATTGRNREQSEYVVRPYAVTAEPNSKGHALYHFSAGGEERGGGGLASTVPGASDGRERTTLSLHPCCRVEHPVNYLQSVTPDKEWQEPPLEPVESGKNYPNVCRTAGSRDEPDIDKLSFTELRDKLLALDPLNKDHVINVNKAEAEYWKKLEGYRVGWSDEILGFDCGGQQWVSETCFPVGSLANPGMKDLEYIEELKKLIESENVPAPAPIEQRWTARSTSLMSPASSSKEDDIFSWVISPP
ncbi:hypothetical protein KSP40_PGU020825 [Platanthera guangdongensis]|uniref:Uncharacterized protein n=1 Tax=Platanthera guangdongensis TaxID=2320717 RepID=A0ABR2MVP4_9ASPA